MKVRELIAQSVAQDQPYDGASLRERFLACEDIDKLHGYDDRAAEKPRLVNMVIALSIHFQGGIPTVDHVRRLVRMMNAIEPNYRWHDSVFAAIDADSNEELLAQVCEFNMHEGGSAENYPGMYRELCSLVQAGIEITYRQRSLVGAHERGTTYWYDAQDHYVYQLNTDGKWIGYLCAASCWDTMRKHCPWSRPVDAVRDQEPGHDPQTCGCKYVAFGMWDCGHTDQH